jgi:hypothetical protein
MTDLLFVLGAQKTGTSTMVGILNCHPSIFVTHEWYIDRKMTKYGQKFFHFYKVPERERMKKRKPVKTAFRNVVKVLGRYGHKYRYFGDKWPRLGTLSDIDRRIRQMKELRVIFMVRDIRTWLVHGIIKHIYKCEEDIVVPSVSYAYYFVKSFLLSQCLRIRMEDMIALPEDTVGDVSNFLDVGDRCMQSWWEKVGTYDDQNKQLHKWWERHKSATVKPIKKDIYVDLNPCPFWDDILGIFDKYYNNHNAVFGEKEILSDLDLLKTFPDKWGKIKLSECYKDVEKKSIYGK